MKKAFVLLFLLWMINIVTAQKPDLILPVGHMGNVRAVSFSGDGKYVLTASDDRTAKIWDVARGRLLHNLEGHTDDIYSAIFSSDGNRILTLSRDKTAKIWDVLTGELIHTSLSPVNFRSTKLFSDGKTILSNSVTRSGDDANESVCLWDIQKDSWSLLYRLNGTIISRANPFPCNADNSCFAFLAADQPMKNPDNESYVVKIADTKTGKVLHKLEKLRNGDLNSADFCPDGKYFLTASEESIKIWDIEAEKLVSTIPGDGYFVFSKDGKKIATISTDVSKEMIPETGTKTPATSASPSTIKICEIPSGKVLKVFVWDSSSSTPLNLSFSPDGNRILIADLYDYILRDIRTGKDLFTMEGSGPAVFSANGKTIVTSANAHFMPSPADDLVPKIWDAQTGRLLHRLEGHTGTVQYAKFSPDGRKVLTDAWPTLAKLWDIKNGKLLYNFKCDSFLTKSVEFSPDGKYILTTSVVSLTKVWDVAGGQLVYSFVVDSSIGKPLNKEFSVKFSPDSKTLVASAYHNKHVRVYDIEKRKLKFSFESPTPVKLTAFNADGTWLGVASNDGTARVWDLRDGKLNITLQVFDTKMPDNLQPDQASMNVREISESDYSGFRSFVFSPDSKYIVTASGNDMNVWDAWTGKLLFKSDPSFSDIASVPFSPDSKRIAADFYDLQASSENQVILQTKILDISTGKVLDTLTGYTVLKNGILKSAFNSHGDRILTLSADNKFKFWSLPSGELLYNLGWEDRERIAASAFFSPDDKFILTSSFKANDRGYIFKYEPLDLWSTESGKTMQTINIGSARPSDINWNRSLVNSIHNSRIGLFDIKSGREKASFVAIDKDDYIFILPSGEYMGTSGAVKYLSWRLNNKLYDFDQWDLQYNRPDKVLEQLDNPDSSLIMMYRKAYQKRLKKAGFTEEMFTTEWHTPESSILNPDEFSVPVSDANKKLRVSFSDSKYTLDRFNVWINDVPVAGKNGISLRSAPARSVSEDIALVLSAGANKIQVSCTNEKGVESLKEEVEIVYHPKSERKPDLFLIGMSVSEYKDNRYSLQYPVKDGRDLVSAFLSKSMLTGNFNTIHLDTLFNGNATKEQFFALKKKLLETKVDDQVVVFISGHGLLNENMDFYYATYDIDFSNPEKRGISFDAMESLLDSIPARKKLLMMDACHSGEVDKDELNEPVASVSSGTTDYVLRGTVKSYSFKGIDAQTKPSGITLQNSFELMQELFAGLDKGTGTTVISAAAGDGYALESPQWNNGVFTYSIINGLKNKAADKNGDGIITISELKDYSIRQVQLLTGGRQKPTARKESTSFDWKVW